MSKWQSVVLPVMTIVVQQHRFKASQKETVAFIQSDFSKHDSTAIRQQRDATPLTHLDSLNPLWPEIVHLQTITLTIRKKTGLNLSKSTNFANVYRI